MNRRGKYFNEDDVDENGTLKDGRSVRVGIMMSDHGRSDIADAYTRSVNDLNAWRDEGKKPKSSAPVADFGTFATLRDYQRMTTDDLSRAEAQADAAFERAKVDLNGWRNA